MLSVKKKPDKFSKFSLPGFRSGSLTKKIIASAYYGVSAVFVLYMLISAIVNYSFSGAGDVILFIVFWIFAVGAFALPVIVVSVSDYYDIHGVKLVTMAVLMSVVCIRCADFTGMFFSDGLKGAVPIDNISIDEIIASPADEDETKIDEEIIEAGIKESEEMQNEK